MERLNWAVLGLLGVITALGLTTSSGAGKSAPSQQPTSITATANAPACSACRSHAATQKPVAVATPATTSKPVADEACAGICQAGGVCCDKNLSKNTVSTVAATDCPLAKTGDTILDLTKNYICEGGECFTLQQPQGNSQKWSLSSKGCFPEQPGTVTITANAEPAKPEGLLDLTAAASAVQPTTGAATFTFTPLAAKLETAKPQADYSRAAARAEKLAEIEAKMAEPWDLEFKDAKLEDIAKQVQEKYGVPVIIDRKALEEAAFGLATPITATKHPENEAGDCLRGMLNDLALTWMIPESNDRIFLTTVTAEQAMPIKRVFDVTALTDTNQSPEALVELIQLHIEPSTWSARGATSVMGAWKNNKNVRLISTNNYLVKQSGPGSIGGGTGVMSVWKNGKNVFLVSTNSYWVQRAVADFLADLRLGLPKNSHQAANIKTAAKFSVAMPVASSKLAADEPCTETCQTTDVCCDMSLSKNTTCEVAATDSPLAKTADTILDLTKNYVCEGSECLAGKKPATLTITVNAEPNKPAGLSNLLAAAETVEAAKPASTSSGSTGSNIILSSEGRTKAGTGTAKLIPQDPLATADAKAANAKLAIGNNRAATRAEKLAMLEAKMAEPISFNLDQNKLDDIREQIRQEKRIEVFIDRKALDEAAFPSDTPIDFIGDNTECGVILRAVLKNYGLTWIIPESNDYVLITTQAVSDSILLPRVYEVSDLFDDSESLKRRIQTIVNPKCWNANGGKCDLAIWQREGKAQLAVNCDYWTHRKLANYFEDLRAARKDARKKTAQVPAAGSFGLE